MVIKRKILFITSNDGTDMRIFKEVKTLSKEFEIHFVGVNQNKISASFVKEFCSKEFYIIGKRKSVFTIIKQFFIIFRLILFNSYNSIHVINEQLLIFFLPILWRQKVVLDIFDSIFLVKNLPNEKGEFFKRLVYSNCDRILVTDANRKMVMPNFTIEKISILENYPFRESFGQKDAKDKNKLRIMFFGWLGEKRGSKIVYELLKASKKVEISMAGWIIDDFTRDLIKHPQVNYLGVMTQKEANGFVFKGMDYILAIYEPSNQNNFFASPNKVFDSIHCEVPLIINPEVNISNFVKFKNIGYVLPSYENNDFVKIVDDLLLQRDTYNFNDELKSHYSWNSIESKLLKVHTS
jgi:hypothetical protein